MRIDYCSIFVKTRIKIMNKQVRYLFLLTFLTLNITCRAQEKIIAKEIIPTSELFKNQNILPIKLNYSNKELKKNTNDSTYVKATMLYLTDDELWKTIEVKLRVRGHNRLENCYFSPLKIKIKKSIATATLFENDTELKLVLPCLVQKDNNDNIIKEFMAYKLYEKISPYHFKTRLVDLDYTEMRADKEKKYQLKGILIEDIEKVAERLNGKVLKRSVHPLEQDDTCSIQNDFFQFMIGNTDFSVAHQHNQKLLFIDKKTFPVPYDFDMSGLVDASYGVVSKIQNENLNITYVTERLYRGFKREEVIYEQVRKEYLDNKDQLLQIVDNLESNFENTQEFSKAKNYILSFFDILSDDQKFQKVIIGKSRIK